MDPAVIQRDHRAVADEVFSRLPEIEAMAQRICRSFRAGGKLMVCGNGGSASDAQHLAGEMVNRFLMERSPYPAMALSADGAVLTSIGNDYDYTEVYSKQVQALGGAEDILIAISTSGNSTNICKAVVAARELGVHTVAWTGGTGGELARLADEFFSVQSCGATPRIQEGHELLMHLLCERIEEIMEGVV